MSKDKDCFNCLHYSACLWNGEYTPTPCRLYEDKTEWSKQSEGEWHLENEEYGKMCCSVCGHQCPTERKPDPYEDYQMTDFYVTSPFCPNCGAKMRKEDEGK